MSLPFPWYQENTLVNLLNINSCLRIYIFENPTWTTLGVAQESRHWDDISELNYLLLADKGHKMAVQLLKFSAVVNKDAYSGWSKCIAGTMYQIFETWWRNSSHNENWIECSLLTLITLGKKLTQIWKCQSTILKVADTPWKVKVFARVKDLFGKEWDPEHGWK